MPAYIVEAAAGLGKTQVAIEAIAKSPHGPYEIYVPTHALAEEVKQRIHAINPNRIVKVIYGRSSKREGAEPPCKKHKVADMLSASGYSVYPNLCFRRGSKDDPSVQCEHHDRCGYIAQFQQADVYIYAHAYLPLERGRVEGPVPYAVVIDETFWGECVKNVEVPLRLLTHPDLPVEARHLCAKVAEYIVTCPLHAVTKLPQCVSENEFRKALLVLQRASTVISPSMSEREIQNKLMVTTPFAPVVTLLKQLYAESRFKRVPQSVVYDHSSGHIGVHYRSKITRFRERGLRRVLRPEPNILILDASASSTIIGQFFPVEQHHKIAVKRNVRVTQCISTRCSTTSITPDKNSDARSMEAAKKRLTEIQRLIESLASTGNRILVGGPSAVVGNPRKDEKPLLICPPTTDFAHFNAIRGMNCWKDAGTVLAVGRNQPPVDAVENIGRALFHDDPQPLTLTGDWVDEPRGYRYTGEELGVMVQVHRDARIQEILEQLREHELLQLIDRIRLIHNDQQKTVILLSNLPLDIDVDELHTWGEIMHGGNRLERACTKLTDGVLPLNAAWLTATFPDLWPTAAAAKQNVGRTIKKEQNPNRNTIRKMFPFAHEYRTDGQRRWSRCLSRFPDATSTEAALQRLVGSTAKVRPAPSVT
jgi:hypothetical protein